MTTPPPKHAFFSELARIINAGQSRSVLLTGEVQDRFYLGGVRSLRAARAVPVPAVFGRRRDPAGLRTQRPDPLHGRRRPQEARDYFWKTGQSLDQLILQSLNDLRHLLGSGASRWKTSSTG